jgi:hypothetical protein
MAAAAVASAVPAAAALDKTSAPATSAGSRALRATFDGMVVALNSGQIDAFYALLHPKLLMIDEDSPWRLDLAGFQDHLGFHGGNLWESFAWKPSDVRVQVAGATGVIAGSATFRGKPKDSGYRLRPLLFSQGWIRDGADWRMVLWHQSPVIGHVTRGSPG